MLLLHVGVCGSVREPDSGFDLMENHWSPDSFVEWGFFHLQKDEARLQGMHACVFASEFQT